MEPLFAAAPYTGYVYPNETVFPWGVLIVVYPYLTGLVAGAFTVSSLYQVFGVKRLRPVAHLALLTCIVPACASCPRRCCCISGIPSARSMPCSRRIGVLQWPCSAILPASMSFSWHWKLGSCSGPSWCSRRNAGKTCWAGFTMCCVSGRTICPTRQCATTRNGSSPCPSPASPALIGLHGYVGFLFGSLKSREWWSSDLMPVIFSVFGDHLRYRAIDRSVCPVLQVAQGSDRRRLREDAGLHAVGLRHVHPGVGGGRIWQYHL